MPLNLAVCHAANKEQQQHMNQLSAVLQYSSLPVAQQTADSDASLSKALALDTEY